MNLPEAEVQHRQAEMDALRRVWRSVCHGINAMTPVEREKYRAGLRTKGVVGMAEYRTQLVAAKTAECAAPVDVSGRLRDAGVEPQHLEGLRNLDERPAFTAARKWWSQPKTQSGTIEAVDDATGELRRVPRLVRSLPFLVLAGASGLGKTQAAAWCVREGVRAYPWNTGASGGRTVPPFLVWHGAAMASTALWGNHSAAAGDDAGRQWDEAERAVVLVLDDLFCQRKPLSGPHQDRLTHLLKARHGASRATIITVNAETPAFATLLDGEGSRMEGPNWRRLSQGGIVVTLQRKGPPTVLRGGRSVQWQAPE